MPGVLVTDVTSLRTAVTDASGSFTLTGLSLGFTRLVFTKSGYRSTATGDLDVNPGQPREAQAFMTAASPTEVSGKAEGVVSDTAGNPVSGATVSVVGVDASTVSTGSDGAYSLDVPFPSGFWYVLHEQKAGHARAFSRALAASAGYRPYQIAHDLVLPAAGATGTIEGRVFEPVSRSLKRSDLWFRTPAGIHRVAASDSLGLTVPNVPAGPVWDCLGVRILPANGTLTIRCTGEPVVPPGTRRLAAGGMVVNRYTAEPVAGATVTFVNGATTVPVTTDTNGIFSYVSGPVGDYSVTATATGFITSDPWAFNATDNQENGNYYGAAFWPEMEQGSAAITAPTEGALLTSLTQISLTLRSRQ
ncbi:MAG: carboxypeptidase regulatory-like domain-containing protein [Acidobacteria bacterium]|nr:carboxypeptidase regulatory-like domain-containing protein [Acidobacteriota bacterium]